MRLNMRIVGKCGFLLAVMGFFMPVACDKNAFQLIEYVDKTSGTLIIILFILAIIGCIIGVLLLMKKNVSIAVDWVIVLASIGIGIGLLSKNELELQYGAYVMITGFSIAFIFVLIASFMSDSASTYNRTVNYDEPFDGANLIVTEELRLWKEPALFSEILMLMQGGTKLKYLSEHDDTETKWLCVETIDGKKGYCIKNGTKTI